MPQAGAGSRGAGHTGSIMGMARWADAEAGGEGQEPGVGVATGTLDRTIQLWEVRRRRPVALVEGHQPEPHVHDTVCPVAVVGGLIGYVTCVAAQPPGCLQHRHHRQLAFSCSNGSVQLVGVAALKEEQQQQQQQQELTDGPAAPSQSSRSGAAPCGPG